MSRPAIRVHGPHRIISEPITFSLEVFINFRTKVKNKTCRRLCTDGRLDRAGHSAAQPLTASSNPQPYLHKNKGCPRHNLQVHCTLYADVFNCIAYLERACFI